MARDIQCVALLCGEGVCRGSGLHGACRTLPSPAVRAYPVVIEYVEVKHAYDKEMMCLDATQLRKHVLRTDIAVSGIGRPFLPDSLA